MAAISDEDLILMNEMAERQRQAMLQAQQQGSKFGQQVDLQGNPIGIPTGARPGIQAGDVDPGMGKDAAGGMAGTNKGNWLPHLQPGLGQAKPGGLAAAAQALAAGPSSAPQPDAGYLKQLASQGQPRSGMQSRPGVEIPVSSKPIGVAGGQPDARSMTKLEQLAQQVAQMQQAVPPGGMFSPGLMGHPMAGALASQYPTLTQMGGVVPEMPGVRPMYKQADGTYQMSPEMQKIQQANMEKGQMMTQLSSMYPSRQSFQSQGPARPSDYWMMTPSQRLGADTLAEKASSSADASYEASQTGLRGGMTEQRLRGLGLGQLGLDTNKAMLEHQRGMGAIANDQLKAWTEWQKLSPGYILRTGMAAGLGEQLKNNNIPSLTQQQQLGETVKRLGEAMGEPTLPPGMMMPPGMTAPQQPQIGVQGPVPQPGVATIQKQPEIPLGINNYQPTAPSQQQPTTSGAAPVQANNPELALNKLLGFEGSQKLQELQKSGSWQDQWHYIADRLTPQQMAANKDLLRQYMLNKAGSVEQIKDSMSPDYLTRTLTGPVDIAKTAWSFLTGNVPNLALNMQRPHVGLAERSNEIFSPNKARKNRLLRSIMGIEGPKEALQ